MKFWWSTATLPSLLLSALLWTGCTTKGNSEQSCVVGGSLLSPTYSCSAGLVCNTKRVSPTCEPPNANAVGGPCGEDDNCQSALWCSPAGVCANFLGAGQSCPSGIGCAPGLVCLKTPTAVCTVEDGGVGPNDSSDGNAEGEAVGDSGDGSSADSGEGSSAATDSCHGACVQGQRCVQLVTTQESLCAGPACGSSTGATEDGSSDGGACATGETCQTVTYNPCPPPPPGQAQCNIASVTYQACTSGAVQGGSDASAE
jgi:hypothetical protein